MRKLFKPVGGKRRGFTLIELLIVLTILAILVAVVAISLTTFVGRGKTEACKTDQRTLQSAVVAYYSEVGAWPSTDLWEAWPAADTPPAAAGDLEPAYVIDIPDSDEDCDWQVSSDGQVYVPDLNVGADCACCEAAADHTWCGTPGP